MAVASVGMALANNTRHREEVDSVLAQAQAAGAKLVKPALEAFWGGFSEYFSDPDGFLWEIAWNPSFQIAEDGSIPHSRLKCGFLCGRTPAGRTLPSLRAGLSGAFDLLSLRSTLKGFARNQSQSQRRRTQVSDPHGYGIMSHLPESFPFRGHLITVDRNPFFFQHYGLTENDLERYLGAALSAGGDYADIYFEYLSSTSLTVDESLVKSASQGISAGCGIRVISGERTGYAYTDDLSSERILHAARTAALIASGPAKTLSAGFQQKPARSLYPVTLPSVDAEITAKVEPVSYTHLTLPTICSV